MVNSDELIGNTEYLTSYARCRINRCRYNRFLLYVTSKTLPLTQRRPSLELIPVKKGTLWNFPSVIRSMGSAGRKSSSCPFSASTVGLKKTVPRSSSYKVCMSY